MAYEELAETRQGLKRWRLLFGLILFLTGAFLFGASLSYSPLDPSLNTATDGETNNLFGKFGAMVADLSFQFIGYTAVLAGLLVAVAGIGRILLPGPTHLFRWVCGLLALVLADVYLANSPPPVNWTWEIGAGGMMGKWLLMGISMPLQFSGLSNSAMWITVLTATGAVISLALCLGLKPKHVASFFQTIGRVGSFVVRAILRVAGGILTGILAVVGGLSRIFARMRERKEEQNVFVGGEEFAIKAPQPVIKDQPKAKKPARRAASTSEAEKPKAKRRASRRFILPTIDFLGEPPQRSNNIDETELLEKSDRLQTVLHEFSVKGKIVEVKPGPIVTLFEFEPAPGVKSSRVISLADDIARSMSAHAARVAVVQGRNAIGIELPNADRETVYLRTLLSSKSFRTSKAALPVALGETIGGEVVIADLAKMPHLLIAGTTGSGKSVGVNAMILSLLFKLSPEQCRLIMIDPKMLELSIYEGIPHLLAPVVTDPQKAVLALKWVVTEMESRYEVMSRVGVRNINGFNDKAKEVARTGQTFTRPVQTGYDKDTGEAIWENEVIDMRSMPHIVVVIDEMADLMIVAGKDIEALVQRLAQMARAAGIHLITATQRPSVDVITGTIKANFPTRISYMVTTKIDSRTILGEQGAEQLVGLGDLLYQASGGKTQRVHGPFVSDEEVDRIVSHLKSQAQPNYVDGVTKEAEPDIPVADVAMGSDSGDAEADLYNQAVEVVRRDKRASTSYIQRRLKVGYNRAASLIERMEDEGVISAPNSAGKREVLEAGSDGKKFNSVEVVDEVEAADEMEETEPMDTPDDEFTDFGDVESVEAALEEGYPEKDPV